MKTLIISVVKDLLSIKRFRLCTAHNVVIIAMKRLEIGNIDDNLFYTIVAEVNLVTK